jgi:hypothetical protein
MAMNSDLINIVRMFVLLTTALTIEIDRSIAIQVHLFDDLREHFVCWVLSRFLHDATKLFDGDVAFDTGGQS